MRQKLRQLMQYGIGTATIVVMCLSGIALMLIVGIGILITKAALFIK